MSKLDKIMAKINKFAQLRYIKILTSSFMTIAAFSVGCSIFSLAKSLPIPIWQTFLMTSGLGDILSIPIDMVSNLYAIMVVICVGYETAKSFDKKTLPAAMIAFGSFMILTPFTSNVTILNEAGEKISGIASGVIGISSMGAQGIFLAMICGILAARLYILLIDKNIRIKMPDSVPPAVGNMFETMLPAGLVFTFFVVLRVIFQQTSFGTMQTFIYTLLQAPLMGIGNNAMGACLYDIACKVLWVFGVHGGMLVYSALGSVRAAAGIANKAAFAAGEAIPYLDWELITPFTNIGILALTILLLFSKAKQYKSLGKLSIATSLFNITEPVVFGFPIILNPIMAIPFIFNNAICLGLTSFVMKIGLVAPLSGAGISNVIPIPIYLWMSTRSISGLIWGLLMVVLSLVIFFPFFKIAEKMALKQELEGSAEEEETL
ncbi:PTS sugar transporter subunit IIC [Holdemania filiformis]|uniref:PTS sugar transporter subunit IIC n=1 Tax=Holdemania filiformis TaxID=61171 RepID=UPI002431C6C8|nr:PTS transporter subunit EIIC [Holdemania filiformis]